MRKCSECSKAVPKPKAGRYSFTCSVKCRKLRERRLRKSKDKFSKICLTCKNSFTAKDAREAYCSKDCKAKEYAMRLKEKRAKEKEERPDFVEQACHYCNKPVWRLANRGGKVSHPVCRDAARRDWNRQKNSKRRKYRFISQSKFMEISIRDEWTCHLCGEEVDETLPRLAKMGASLDHVLPLSKGGTDHPENLKLAHFICNVRKGNRIE